MLLGSVGREMLQRAPARSRSCTPPPTAPSRSAACAGARGGPRRPLTSLAWGRWTTGRSEQRRVPALSRVDLDDLLTELRERAGAVQPAHERLSALLDAVVAVSSDLDLAAALERIVATARVLSAPATARSG